MARIRTIKPEFFSDEELASCSPHARLLAIALLQLADCKGRFKYIEMQIHAHAFPWEAEVKIPVLLGELQDIGYADFYRIDGKTYGFIPGFNTHQRLTGKEAQTESAIPEFKQEYQIDIEGKQRGNTERFTEKHPDAQEREREREREREKENNSVELNSTGVCGEHQIDDQEKPAPKKQTGNSSDVNQVFEYWKTTMNHPRAALDAARKRLISNALKSYSVDACCDAITGASLTPHNMGENDRGQKYDGLNVILRNADQIDRFIGNAKQPPTQKMNGSRVFNQDGSPVVSGRVSPRVERTLEAIREVFGDE